MPSIDQRYPIEILRCVQDVLRCSQMFTNVFRWSQMFLDFLEIFYTCPLVVVFFLDVLLMFSGCLQDFFRMLWWVLWAWWNLIIISNESMDFNHHLSVRITKHINFFRSLGVPVWDSAVFFKLVTYRPTPKKSPCTIELSFKLPSVRVILLH